MMHTTHAGPRRRPRWPSRCLISMLMLAGAVVSSWPVGQTMLGNRAAARETQAYVEQIEQARTAAPPPGSSEGTAPGAVGQAGPRTRPSSARSPLDQQFAAARAYNSTLTDDILKDPWGAGDEHHDARHGKYLQQLALTEAMARLRIDDIRVDLPVHHDADEASLARGVGHMYGSSLPVGGPGTHAVLAAHTGSTSKSLFDRLPELRLGQQFEIEVSGARLTYLIDDLSLVKPDELARVLPVQGRDLVSLVTCITPPGGPKHGLRLLVRGTRVSSTGTPAAHTIPAGTADPAHSRAATVPDPAATAPDPAEPSTALPVGVDHSIQQWMWPRLLTSAGALLLLGLMWTGWLRRDRGEDPRPTGRRAR